MKLLNSRSNQIGKKKTICQDKQESYLCFTMGNDGAEKSLTDVEEAREEGCDPESKKTQIQVATGFTLLLCHHFCGMEKQKQSRKLD